MKKIINLALLTIFIASVVQAAYIAEKPEGDGTKYNPYLISKLENLLWMSENSRNLEPGAYFSQTCDIDAAETENWRNGFGFPPISAYDGNDLTNYFFTGTYNGNNFAINNLFIKQTDREDYVAGGLFSAISNAFLCNITINNAKLHLRSGGASLVAYMHNSTVSNCHAQARFFQDWPVDYMGSLGGLVGLIHYSGTIIRSSAEVIDLKGSAYLGGLFYMNRPPETLLIPYKVLISECFTKGNVGNPEAWRVGGVAGDTNGKCINCYSWCDVDGKMQIGGFAGACGTVENCYVFGKVTGGKPISDGWGSHEGKGVYYCSEEGEDDHAIGKTFEEMKHQATYEGWDFDNVWYIDEGESLPTLQWETPEPGLVFILLPLLYVSMIRKR
ncbi:hypothetical protein J5754_00750 [bacterium]|nr:hypothetical protein [bacterium]